MLAKLLKIQTDLKCNKGQYNKFGEYYYRSCEDIFEAVKPLLNKYKLVLMMKDEIMQVGERYYIKATAELYDLESEKVIKTEAYAREPQEKTKMDAAQITGTASSYARKYALNGLFLIDDTKDADTDEYKAQQEAPKQQPKAQTRKLSATTVKIIEDLITQTGSNKAELLNYYHVNDISEMTQDAAKHCVGVLKGRLNGQA